MTKFWKLSSPPCVVCATLAEGGRERLAPAGGGLEVPKMQVGQSGLSCSFCSHWG